jgi:hypothetical protein
MTPDRAETHREWARLGALARLQQIEQERVAILTAFPDLRRKSSVLPMTSGLVVRKRRTISAKGRRAMSAGMRKYWAKRRAASRKSN